MSITYPAPTEPGYYWAKLKTPSGGIVYINSKPIEVPIIPDWASTQWEIVDVWENGGNNPDEYLAVYVPGVYVTQWIKDFCWGPKVNDQPPSS